MTLEELKAMEWERASRFYGGCPDSQWDTEAQFACLLMPDILALVEAAKQAGGDNAYMVSDALDAFNAKLESL